METNKAIEQEPRFPGHMGITTPPGTAAGQVGSELVEGHFIPTRQRVAVGMAAADALRTRFSQADSARDASFLRPFTRTVCASAG